jgi:hypothetical protein
LWAGTGGLVVSPCGKKFRGFLENVKPGKKELLRANGLAYSVLEDEKEKNVY